MDAGTVLLLLAALVALWALSGLFRPKIAGPLFSAFAPTIYIQISPERIALRNVKSGETITDIPEIAIGKNPVVILAVGMEARQIAARRDADVINPFAHPRSMVSDFTVAEQLLKYYVKKCAVNPCFPRRPSSSSTRWDHPPAASPRLKTALSGRWRSAPARRKPCWSTAGRFPIGKY